MGAEARTNAATKAALEHAHAELLTRAIPFDRHKLIDAYGKPVEVGGMYAVHMIKPMPGHVVDIKPILAQNAPPDAYEIVVMVEVRMRAMSRAPIPSLIWIAPPPDFAQQAGDGQLQTPPADPPAGEPPPQSAITLTDL